MNILFISLLLPHPYADHAMAFTIYKLIALLSKKHTISVVSFVRSEQEKMQAEHLQSYCRHVETVVLPHSIYRRIGTRARMLAGIPLAFSGSSCSAMRKTIRQMLAKESFDVVQMDYTMGQYVSEVSDAVAVLYVLDLIYEKAKRLAENSPFSRKKLEWWLESIISRAYEKKLYSKFDVVLAISSKIKSSLLACNPALDVSVLPPGVDIPENLPPRFCGKRYNIMFMGAMWRPENIDAVLYFYRHVFRRIRSAIPEAAFYIVGGSPGEEITKLASAPGVTVTGYVDNLASVYEKCDVSVAPIRMSGGVHCKILDAMAFGLPVITTTAGNDGIGAQPEKEILIADTAEDFARCTIELLKDSERRREIGLAGLEFVRTHFDWKPVIEELERFYQAALP